MSDVGYVVGECLRGVGLKAVYCGVGDFLAVGDFFEFGLRFSVRDDCLILVNRGCEFCFCLGDPGVFGVIRDFYWDVVGVVRGIEVGVRGVGLCLRRFSWNSIFIYSYAGDDVIGSMGFSVDYKDRVIINDGVSFCFDDPGVFGVIRDRYWDMINW